MNPTLPLLVLLLTGFLPNASAVRVYLQVLDNTNNTPVSGALIFINGTVRAQSNMTGIADLGSLNINASYALSLSAGGYQPTIYQITNIPNTPSTMFTVRMKPVQATTRALGAIPQQINPNLTRPVALTLLLILLLALVPILTRKPKQRRKWSQPPPNMKWAEGLIGNLFYCLTSKALGCLA